MDAERSVCELCFPGTHAIGGIGPFVMAKLDSTCFSYGLYLEPCHKGDEVCIWLKGGEPTPDPVTDENEEELNTNEEFFELSEKWMEIADPFLQDLKTDLRYSWRIVELLRKEGYNPDEDGSVHLWLYDKLGLMIKEFEGGQEGQGTDQQSVEGTSKTEGQEG